MKHSSQDFAMVPAHQFMTIEPNDRLGITNAFNKSIVSDSKFDIQDPSLLLYQPAIKIGVNQSASLTNTSPIFHKFNQMATDRMKLPNKFTILHEKFRNIHACSKVINP